jgi:hypothetical protein
VILYCNTVHIDTSSHLRRDVKTYVCGSDRCHSLVRYFVHQVRGVLLLVYFWEWCGFHTAHLSTKLACRGHSCAACLLMYWQKTL